jgi:hypothetical protein
MGVFGDHTGASGLTPHPLRTERVITLLILLAGLFLAISVSVAAGVYLLPVPAAYRFGARQFL